MRNPRSLSGKARFATVFSEGRRAESDGLTVWALPRSGREVRVGMAVSARAGGAVSRNRTRRRLRALVRDSECLPGDLVIRAGSAALELSFQELAAHLGNALAASGATR